MLQLQSALDETRFRLHHEQMASQDLKAQLAEEKRRKEVQEQQMEEKLNLPRIQIGQLHAEVERAEAMLHRQKEELHRQLEDHNDTSKKMKIDECSMRQCENELLGALLEHAAVQLTAREDSSLKRSWRRLGFWFRKNRKLQKSSVRN